LVEVPERRLSDIVKTPVSMVGVIIRLIIMFRTIGPLSRRDHVRHSGNPRRRAAHRSWGATVKVDAIVAASVLIAVPIAFVFL